MDKISIIVPVYNIEQYLERCIISVCNQTCNNLEIILVDDGSTDDSGKICNYYAVQDRRVKVIHKENGGLVSARKAGLEHACGKYIGFVDGDDYLEPEMYAELLKVMQQTDVDFVHSGYYKDGRPSIYGTASDSVFEINHKNNAHYLRKYVLDPNSEWIMSPSIWSKLFRRDVLLKAYSQVPNENSYGEDLLCLCCCILESQKFAIVNRAYYHYVIREDSIYHTANIQNIWRENRLRSTLWELIAKYGLLDELYEELEKFYFYSVVMCIKHLGNTICSVYQYPSIEELADKKIILYGAGEVGQDYYTQLRRDTRCEVVAVTDTCYDRYHLSYMDIISPEKALEVPYDLIIISVLQEHTARAITDKLMEMGVQREKIVWKKPALTV